MKRPIPLHPPLFALFPILFFYSRNLGEFRIHALLAPAAQAVILTVAAWVGVGWLLKNFRKAAVLLSLFVIEFFSFGHAVALLDTAQPSLGLSEWASEALLAAVFVAAFLAVVLWSGKWRGRLEAPTKVLNLVAVLLVAVPAASITAYEAKTWRARRQKHRFSHVKLTVPQRPPNIYYIILDAYGRGDSLSEFYGFDNTEFVDFLRSKGFYVSGKSTSNYSHTVLSIASSLNFTYIEGLLERVEPGDNIPLHEMIGRSRVAGLLKDAGYRFVSFAGRREIYNADIYMAPPRRSDFERGLLNTTAAASAASQRERDRQAIRHVLEKLPETASMPHPVFVYAHIM